MKTPPKTSVRDTSRLSAFTLSELLIASVLIAIVLAFCLVVAGHIHGRAQGVRCLSNLRQIGSLFSQYLADHQMRFPQAYEYETLPNGDRKTIVWYQHLWPYLPEDGREIFKCPKGSVNRNYAFERRISDRPHQELLSHLLPNGNPSPGKRWILMDGNWYFLEIAHGITGSAGTNSVAVFRHAETSNVLMPDFSVHSMTRDEINRSLYVFQQYPIP